LPVGPVFFQGLLCFCTSWQKRMEEAQDSLRTDEWLRPRHHSVSSFVKVIDLVMYLSLFNTVS
jgi:hypothetical protein